MRMDSEQLKPIEFDVHIKNGSLRLAFVGMSNAGKSYRSKILRDQAGFLWYHVDNEIQKTLGIEDLSSWLGHPSSEGYTKRQAEYLGLEDKFTRQAAIDTGGQNLVFDTTGSVIHLSKETLALLSDNCLVVHLDVGESSLPAMMEKFFANPKPVAWDTFFSMLPGETEEAALRRCYPALLSERLRRYRELAHINIPADDVRDKSAVETLRIICDRLTV